MGHPILAFVKWSEWNIDYTWEYVRKPSWCV